jgi:HSP20 family molecular chaperone IbpA
MEIAGRRLWVRGERKEKERVGILRRRERTVGRFSCEVLLPATSTRTASKPTSRGAS